MADRPRPRRSPARFLAPVALAIAVLGVYLVAQHALGGSASTRSHVSHRSLRPASRRHHTTTSQTTTTSTSAGARFYRVRSGDNLSVISVRTGVSLATLELLNPKVSSNSLQVGQRLRLRR